MSIYYDYLTIEEMLGEEDIKFSDELINSEFIKAYDLISELD